MNRSSLVNEGDPFVAGEVSASGIVTDAQSKSIIETNEPRNLLVLAAYQIMLRIGWIFKTESVIMPAVVDMLAPPGMYGWLRGLLPVLNRLGQSIPPMLMAGRLQRSRLKRRALLVFTLCSAAPNFGFCAIWLIAPRDAGIWPALVFLLLYAVFHACNGLLIMSFGTLQGKLIRPTRRGRLLAVSSSVGAVGAILFAWWLMPGWLEQADGGFGFVYIFTFTGVCFLLGAAALTLVVKPPDGHDEAAAPGRHFAVEVWQLLRRDGNFRWLVAVSLLFSVSLILFPHYQALGRMRLDLDLSNLMLWVVVQNAGTGVFSLLAGPLADRHGTRLAMRALIFLVSLPPAVAAWLAYGASPETGRSLFWLVFVLVGLTPVTMKTLVNYTLEISSPAEHPRYLSTLSLCIALPFVLSPAVGWLVDAVGFLFVFLAGAGLVALGGLLTFWLVEPRGNHEGETAR